VRRMEENFCNKTLTLAVTESGIFLKGGGEGLTETGFP
jgi:hypothetical protein